MMPDLHWLWARQATFINFSFTLHERVRRLGARSRLLRYVLPPVPIERRATFHGGLRVFLWQRRPEHGINLHMVERLFAGALRSVHIHNAPDDDRIDTRPYLERRLDGYDLTVSRWFENPADYGRLLDRSNVFVAPRLSEGIGMALLEAMSRGMLVAAAHFPTHTEYVANRVNGVLFNPDDVGPADFSDAADMGALAWRSAEVGHSHWQAHRPGIAHAIRATPAPETRLEVDPATFAAALTRAHDGSDSGYAAFLLQNLPSIEAMSGLTLRGRVTSAAGLAPEEALRPKPPTPESDYERRLPWLENGRIDLTDARSEPHLVEGAVERAAGVAWMRTQGLALGFHVDPSVGGYSGLTLAVQGASREVGRQVLAISLNGETLGFIELTPQPQELTFDLVAHPLKADNVLRLQCSAMGGEPVIASPVAAGLGDLRFT
jgi:hypothetical protein